jgi:hypothetical protein
MKNSNGTIGNRTRDLPVCSTVPQPTAPPSKPIKSGRTRYIFGSNILPRNIPAHSSGCWCGHNHGKCIQPSANRECTHTVHHTATLRAGARPCTPPAPRTLGSQPSITDHITCAINMGHLVNVAVQRLIGCSFFHP